MQKRNPVKEFDYDKKLAEEQAKSKLLAQKYAKALSEIKVLEKRNSAVVRLRNTINIETITPVQSSGNSEATCVWVASDWHVEENVDSATIGGLNEYNMKIAKERSQTFFRAGLKLTNALAEEVEIKTIVLALLGDFFTNDIHDELVEVNEVGPMHAAIYAQNLIASGIEYILKNSKYDLLIPCASGNHARTSKTTHFSTENAHSLEYFMYRYLENHFRKNKRVKFLIPNGYHQYVKIYDTTLRFHHGHAMKYQGGVGGITIPVNKAIAQWNKAIKADIDVFGHWHQFFDGGNFICNGSMIGYNVYALTIKASFEKPKQALFLIDRDRGKTCVWPILF